MINEQTFEFGQARLKLKDSLSFSMRQIGGGIEYLIEDEVTGRFFRVGLSQYTFLTMLDGRRTVSTAMMKCATLLREHAIDENSAAGLCKWAIESGLIESESGNSAARRTEQFELLRRRKLASFLNPLMVRLPLFSPDRIISRIAPYTNFLISPLGLLIWLIVVAYGFLHLASDWNTFVTGRVETFDTRDFLWLALTWLLLKLIHELAHGLVCKRFGGRVSSFGVLLLLLIPLPFVDVTSSWRFADKWRRVLTSAAGMMSEIFIAAIACLVWLSTAPGPLQYHAGNIIISATLHTLLFNINPLMRFDGYYMLTDLLEIPNLATTGRQWLLGFVKWVYFGKRPAPLKETGFRAIAVRVYGVLSIMWFGLVAVGLSLAASSMIEGLGLLVATIALGMWIGLPLYRLAKYTICGTDTEKPNRIRFAAAIAISIASVAGFLLLIPSPTVISAPVVIDYEPLSVVRARAPGFASKIHVRDGQLVEAGDILVTLENLELQQELDSLNLDIKISELRSSTMFKEGKVSSVQLEREALESLCKRQRELQQQIDALEIHAPQSGQVLARDLSSLEGKHFALGDELLSIGTPGQIQAIALTQQTDIDWIASRPEAEVQLMVWGRDKNQIIPGKIKTINPRARDDPPHEAFTAVAGGPLPVVSRNQVEGGDTQSEAIMLTQPRVPIEIELTAIDRQALYSGQTGQLIVRSRHQKMGPYLTAKLIRFVERSNLRTHGL